MSPTARRFPWWAYVLALIVILVIALAPVGSVVVAGVLADLNGCALDEGSIHPCLIGGSDWGETLYTLGMMGWFMIASLPLGVMALAAWLVVLLLHRAYWGRRKATP